MDGVVARDNIDIGKPEGDHTLYYFNNIFPFVRIVVDIEQTEAYKISVQQR